MKLGICIPCYNCENQIGRVLDKIFSSGVVDRLFAIIVLDNRSTDQTFERARDYFDSLGASNDWPELRILVLKNEQNVSLGGSHKIGFGIASSLNLDYLCVLHGDDQADFRDFERIVDEGKFEEFDAILGSRFMVGSQTSCYDLKRRVGNQFFNFLYSSCLRTKISDMGSGLNIYSKKLMASGLAEKCPNSLMFHCYFLILIVENEFSYIFSPISWKSSDEVSNARVVKQSFQVFLILAQLVFSRRWFLRAKFGRGVRLASSGWSYNSLNNVWSSYHWSS